MAEKRLHCLNSRFFRNPKFFADYKGFIDDLLIKGYAKKSTENPRYWRTCWISYYGVYHPNMSGEIRLVFDCSTDLSKSIAKQEPYEWSKSG